MNHGVVTRPCGWKFIVDVACGYQVYLGSGGIVTVWVLYLIKKINLILPTIAS
jgi:hypothetical protein